MIPSSKALLRTLGLTSTRAWHGRLVVWIAAAVAAIVIVFFAWLVDRAIAFFESVYTSHMWLAMIMTTLGGAGIAWATKKWFTGSEGSGIPQVIVAEHLEASPNPDQTGLVSLRIIIGKIFLGAGALACGFSAGREGPSVQIGASVMYLFRRFLPKRFPIGGREMLLAGGAAGIAAAFNTPLAGIVFAIEELGNRMETRTNGVILSAIVLSGAISVSFVGNYLYFGRLSIYDSADHMIGPVILTGLVGGAMAGMFSRLMYLGSGPLWGKLGDFKRDRPVAFAGLCSLGVAILGYISDGAAFGSGYQVMRQALSGDTQLSNAYPVVKFFSTLLSYFAGVPGGIFAPCLAIGGGLGNSLSNLNVFALSDQAWMALAMTAFLAGVTQAPITSFVIVMEMIDGHAMVISLMAVALLSGLISRGFSRPIYHALARRMLQRRKTAAHAAHMAANMALPKPPAPPQP